MPVENFTLPPCGTAERPGEEQKRVPHHEQQEQDGHGGMEVAGGELHGLGHECAHRAVDEFGQEEFFCTGEREEAEDKFEGPIHAGRQDEPDDDELDKGQASGSSFEDIDMAVRTIRKDTPSDEEMRHAGKVMTELDGTELFSRITESLTDEAMSGRLAKAMAVFVDTVNMTVTRQKDKVFVIPDKIEEFDIRDYV